MAVYLIEVREFARWMPIGFFTTIEGAMKYKEINSKRGDEYNIRRVEQLSI